MCLSDEYGLMILLTVDKVRIRIFFTIIEFVKFDSSSLEELQINES